MSKLYFFWKKQEKYNTFFSPLEILMLIAAEGHKMGAVLSVTNNVCIWSNVSFKG